MKNTLLMAVALLTLSVTSQALANTNDYVGLWETVEPDGSRLIFSMTDIDDGTVKLLLYDTFWTLCNGGRGIEQGAGQVPAAGILKTDDFPVTCFETGETQSVPVTFTSSPAGTLTQLSSGLFPPIVFHRTSP